MIDQELLFWDGNTAPQTIDPADSLKVDLGPVRPGPGEIVVCWLTASSQFNIGADSPLTLNIRHSADSSAWEQLMAIVIRDTDPCFFGSGKTMWAFALPSNVRRYVDIYFELTGPTAGVFSAGVNINQQTNP